MSRVCGAATAWTGLALLAIALAGAGLGADLRDDALRASCLLALSWTGAACVLAAAKAVSAPLLVAALLGLRVIALVGQPTLSDDWYRYVHEGRAQRLGLAVPYAQAPATIRPPPDDGITDRVNHNEVPAAYPPGSELVLLAMTAAGDVLGQPMLPLRILLVASDMLVLWLLYRARGRTPAAFAAYGAHPLPLLEISLGGHLDGLGVSAILVAVLTTRPAVQGALIGLGAHVKPIAALALVGVRRAGRAQALLAFAVALTLPALPYLAAGAPLTRGLVEYSTRWRAAPFLYEAIEAPLRPVFEQRAEKGRYAQLHVRSDGLLVEERGKAIVSIGAAHRADRPILLDAGFFARILAGALVAVVLRLLSRARMAPDRRVGFALTALWLLAPTVHPWYLTWIVPFAALSSSKALWAFAAASPLLYQPTFAFARGDGWHEDLWPRGLVLLALLGGALLDALDARRGSVGAATMSSSGPRDTEESEAAKPEERRVSPGPTKHQHEGDRQV